MKQEGNLIDKISLEELGGVVVLDGKQSLSRGSKSHWSLRLQLTERTSSLSLSEESGIY